VAFITSDSDLYHAFPLDQSTEICRWWLIKRYQKQAKITARATVTSPAMKKWCGVRQVIVPLNGLRSKQNHRGSLLDWTMQVYRSRSQWPTWLPLGRESVTKSVPLFDEVDDPMAIYLEWGVCYLERPRTELCTSAANTGMVHRSNLTSLSESPGLK
jgi:hypothetical protein